MTSILEESAQIKKVLESVAKDTAENVTRSAARYYKAIVITQANGQTMGVKRISDTTILNLPYTPAVASMGVGSAVWVQVLYNNWNTAIVFADVAFKTIGAYINPNLLINSNFAINQRGQSTYSTTNAYGVDRWKNSNTTQSTSGQGISISGVGANGYIHQLLEDYQQLRGYTVTLSVYIDTLTYTSGIPVISIYDGTAENSDTIPNGFSGIVTVTKTISATASQLSCRCLFNNSSTANTDIAANILWAKLEVGDHATPYSPPLIADELPKCRRYYFRPIISSATDKQIIRKLSRSTAYFYDGIVDFPYPMRDIPTVKIFSYYDDTEGALYNVTSGSNRAMTISEVNHLNFQIYATTGSLTSNNTLVGYYEADAEL